MNFLVKSGLYKVFFTYYEILLTKNLKKIIYLLNQFYRAKKSLSFKQRKNLKYNFLGTIFKKQPSKISYFNKIIYTFVLFLCFL
jgi:hypothetical protein